MAVLRHETVAVRSGEDVVSVRQAARQWAIELGFSLVEQTKIVTAASELARNTITHGGGGTARLEVLNDQPRRGLRITFEDQGPGIPGENQERIFDQFQRATTSEDVPGMGLGLWLVRRIVAAHGGTVYFDSSVERGSTATITLPLVD